MRNAVAKPMVALLVVLVLPSVAMAQRGRPVPEGFIKEGVPKMVRSGEKGNRRVRGHG